MEYYPWMHPLPWQTGWWFTQKTKVIAMEKYFCKSSFINIIIWQHVNWFGLLSDAFLGFALSFACFGNGRRRHVHLKTCTITFLACLIVMFNEMLTSEIKIYQIGKYRKVLSFEKPQYHRLRWKLRNCTKNIITANPYTTLFKSSWYIQICHSAFHIYHVERRIHCWGPRTSCKLCVKENLVKWPGSPGILLAQ